MLLGWFLFSDLLKVKIKTEVVVFLEWDFQIVAAVGAAAAAVGVAAAAVGVAAAVAAAAVVAAEAAAAVAAAVAVAVDSLHTCVTLPAA